MLSDTVFTIFSCDACDYEEFIPSGPVVDARQAVPCTACLRGTVYRYVNPSTLPCEDRGLPTIVRHAYHVGGGYRLLLCTTCQSGSRQQRYEVFAKPCKPAPRKRFIYGDNWVAFEDLTA